MPIPFHKMHGAGNDFIIIDNRTGWHAVPPATIRAMAARHTGIGCDQLIIMEPPATPGADVFMRIYNPDGTQAGACGNATRCVATLLLGEGSTCTIETLSGLLPCTRAENESITVDMGPPQLAWKTIPLAEERGTLDIGIEYNLSAATAVGMGNPHCVFFVADVNAVPLESIGPVFENHPLFPEKTNVEFAQILAPGKIHMRVWERGAGATLACGSGACAVMVAAVRRGLAPRRAEIIQSGGTLFLEWREPDNHVLMTGPAAFVFTGQWGGYGLFN